ncbi:MAG: sigma-70 family RNA polymerase sigma factor [Planctomycetaceae bacterium]|nr:sigma-70 family RNA polymerase sigma factor [Planctomycetaceae bacterium]
MASDGDLVRLALGGQLVAYEELVRRWSARVLAVCHSKVRSALTAEELAQETLLRGFRALRTLDDPAKFGPWLCGIAARASLDWLKSGQARQVSLEGMSDGQADAWVLQPGETPEEATDRADEHRRLLGEVAALPEVYREVILLYYYDDVTYQELAAILGVSTATVNSRLTKARALLRERLTGLKR